MYDKGEHLDWWHGLPASERFDMMKKYNHRPSNKGIYLMYHQHQSQ